MSYVKRAFSMLVPRYIGDAQTVFGTVPVYTRPSIRWFLVLLLAGDKTVMVNASFKGGALDMTGKSGALVVHSEWRN